MKILRILSSGYGEGGAENGVLHMQGVLEARGHEIRILSTKGRADRANFNHYSYEAPHGPFEKLMYIYNWSAMRELKKALREFNPDVIHLHTLGAASPAILFALDGYPTVATVHGPEGYTKELIKWCMPKSDFTDESYEMKKLTPMGALRFFFYRWVNYPLYRLGFANIDRFVTISTYIRDVMSRQGVESTYIPNGIKLFPYAPLDASKIPHTLVFSGRLEKFKGLEYVIRAMPSIVTAFPDTILHVAGEGRDRKELESLVATLGIQKHVVFHGHVSREVLHALYEKASASLVPSIWPEVCSRAGIEAMSVGRPVIGSRVGGTPDWLIDGVSGYLVPPADADAIAKAVQRLFAEPKLHARLSAGAREVSLAYAIERHADGIEKVYAEVVRAHDQRETDDVALPQTPATSLG